MSDYCIRLYKNSDLDTARDIFDRGIMEHTSGAFKHALRHIWIFMIFVFLFPLAVTGSIALSVLALILVLVIIWVCIRHIYYSYLQHSLDDDMLDIHKYYLQRDGYCFWVAECAGQVVGMVAAVPSLHPNGKKHVEMKRMSVAKGHRGKGIAKALCRTLIDFARERGCDAVVLETTLPQTDAQQLYEKMGFQSIGTYYALNRMAKLIDFRILRYRYDIPRPR
ncbi:putative N-acetyltransferase family 8 member 5 [Discoglossus pictus]